MAQAVNPANVLVVASSPKMSRARNAVSPRATRLIAMPATIWLTLRRIDRTASGAPESAQKNAHHHARDRAACKKRAQRRTEGARQHHALHSHIVDAAALADDAAECCEGNGHHQAQAGAQHIPQDHPVKHSSSPPASVGRRVRGAARGVFPSVSRQSGWRGLPPRKSPRGPGWHRSPCCRPRMRAA